MLRGFTNENRGCKGLSTFLALGKCPAKGCALTWPGFQVWENTGPSASLALPNAIALDGVPEEAEQDEGEKPAPWLSCSMTDP